MGGGETSCILLRDKFSAWPRGRSGSSRVCVCGVLLSRTGERERELSG